MLIHLLTHNESYNPCGIYPFYKIKLHGLKPEKLAKQMPNRPLASSFASKKFAPPTGIEPGSPAWEAGVLTIRPWSFSLSIVKKKGSCLSSV